MATEPLKLSASPLHVTVGPASRPPVEVQLWL